jgi:outer membrane protein TolC
VRTRLLARLALVLAMTATSLLTAQTVAPERSGSSAIPPPRPYQAAGPMAQPARAAATTVRSQTVTPPSAGGREDLPNVPALRDAGLAEVPSPIGATVETVLDTSLIPGRSIEPIDLPNALRLAGVRGLDIALATQGVNQSIADLQFAWAQWLPSLFLGPTWYRADGQVQTVTGPVQNVNRSSLFLGGVAATTAPGYAAPSPGTGYAPLNGSSAVFRFSDAIYGPLAARRVVNAGQAGVHAANNNTMLEVAEAYFDLQQACGLYAISREAVGNAKALSDITGSYARTGQGLEADHHRALTELNHRRKEMRLYTGQLLVASANLVRLLVLDPKSVIAPIEPAESIIILIPDTVSLDELVVRGLRNRPELAGAQELVEATLLRFKQAKLRPFVPSLAVSYAGGGFGGGPGSFFGDFGARGDVAASLFWELQNLGFGDLAIIRRKRFENREAGIQQIKVEAQVAADVVSAYELKQAAALQIKESRETVAEAIESLKLNMINIRHAAELPRATRPIEVLQPIQALVQARNDYLESVLGYNRAQFRLNRAIGNP